MCLASADHSATSSTTQNRRDGGGFGFLDHRAGRKGAAATNTIRREKRALLQQARLEHEIQQRLRAT
jgi:hypothetical protein